MANKRSKFEDETPGPWTRWRTHEPAERAIRFIETYCRPPKGYGYGKTLKLAEFQKAWIRRTFRPGVNASMMQVARGNGKSTLLAGLALWALFDISDSGDPQVPIVATTVGQAKKSVYDVALRMIDQEEALSSRCKVFTAVGADRVLTNANGQMFPIANDPDGLQGLDPSFAVVDEIGFQPIETWTSLLLATGKRPNSLVVGIGTPGFDRNNALWTTRQRFLEGGAGENFVFQEYSAPEDSDPEDEATWHLANPALAEGFINIGTIRNNLRLSPLSHFQTFHLGMWVDGTNAWLGDDGRKLWESLTDPYELVPGAPTWVGLDVGLKRDSTALVIGQRRPEGRVHAKARIWMPKAGEVIDPSLVMQAIRDLDAKYQLVEVAYDPRLFEFPAMMLADEGIPMVEFPQSLERMTPAFGALYEAIHNKDLTHDGDQAFNTQILNGVPRYNERGFTLMKAKSRGKIDACYALAIMYSRISQPVKPRSTLYIGVV